MADNKETKSYYCGHRQRLRTRYLENGIDSLLEHEILELFLFYSMPRVDTKPLAHRLIDTYGSLKNVLDASYESLRANGLSESSAVSIKLFCDMNGWIRKNKIAGSLIGDYNEAGLLMVSEFDSSSSEKLIVVMMNSKNEIIEIKTVCEGSFRSTNINMKNLVQSCLNRKAAKVILAHNHPSGDIRPSADDHVTTASVENYLSGVGIELVEHYIIADGTYFGILRNSEEARRSFEEHYRHGFGFDET